MAQDIDFDTKLREAFVVEADEHITAIIEGIAELESHPEFSSTQVIIEKMFREAHSLKGAARIMNFSKLADLCQAIESVFSELKHQKLDLHDSILQSLSRATDILQKLQHGSENHPINDLLKQLDAIARGQPIEKRLIEDPQISSIQQLPETSSFEVEKIKTAPSSPETVRIRTDRLDALFLRSEELLALKLRGNGSSDLVNNLHTTIDDWKRDFEALLPDLQLLRRFIDEQKSEGANTELEQTKTKERIKHLCALCDRSTTTLRSFSNSMSSLKRQMKIEQRQLAGLVDEVRDDMKRALMLPCGALLETLNRAAREIATAQGKEIEVTLLGKEREFDRRVLEEIKEALIHIVRNAIDHGIEIPQERRESGKLIRAKLTISVTEGERGQALITISDDGRGIDVEKIKEKALAQGLITPEVSASLDERTALCLILRSGLSTKEEISQISGRGLGLAIAEEKARKLGGVLEIESTVTKGTTFRFIVPLTIAALRSVFVRMSHQTYVVPLHRVIAVQSISIEEVKRLGSTDILLFEGKPTPLVILSSLIGIPDRETSSTSQTIPVLILSKDGKTLALAVDEILREQEVVMKYLPKPLYRVKFIDGVTIVGAGTILPVLHIGDVFESLGHTPQRSFNERPTSEDLSSKETIAVTPQKKQSVLVAEDSITARVMLKNILEAAGFQVVTAVDGLDALATLKSGVFDMVISDVDMPRMSGFDLTTAIRNDRKYEQLPIVLVSGREAVEDQARGLEVGANAYVVKSSFDQTRLLQVIRNLL